MICFDMGVRGACQFLILADKGGGGVCKAPFLADIICEQPLRSNGSHFFDDWVLCVIIIIIFCTYFFGIGATF